MNQMSRRPFLALAGFTLLRGTLGRAAELPAPSAHALFRDESQDGSPPPAVNRPARIRQTLVPGTVYEVLAKGTIKVDAEDQSFVPLLQLSGNLTINYGFQARIERHIVYNDGKQIVEDRYFHDVRAIKVGTNVRDVQLQPGPAGQLLLDLVPLAPVGQQVQAGLTLLKKFLPHALGFLAALESRTPRGGRAGAILALNGLSGKAVRLHYVDGQGVTRLEPLEGTITPAERAYHMSSMVLSDCLLFPDEKVSVGDTYDVPGESLGDLMDPFLLAHVGGSLEIGRVSDQLIVWPKLQLPARRHVVAEVRKGQLEFRTGSGLTEQGIGTFSPTGKIYFDAEKKLIVAALLRATGELRSSPSGHLLHGAHHFYKPTLELTYSCKVLHGPEEEGSDGSSPSR
jgi:hypothetical protein